VVHQDHGIGRYGGLISIPVGNSPHDCVALTYSGGDKLYVPVENIDVLSRYGSDSEHVTLDKLGGEAWQRRKSKLKERIRAIAGELLKTAAERALRAGLIIEVDGPAYASFVDRFPYEETDDQLNAIGDVLDRVNLTPMATAVGHALADTLFGNNPRRVSYENVPTAVFMNPPIGTVGITEEEAAKRGPADIYVTRFTPMRHTISKREGRKTLMKLVVCQRTQKILGAHMIGEDAGEMMQGIGIAVVMGATKQDFDRTIGIHPTAAEEFVTLRTRTRVVGA
jgi:hypothetical protein